MTISEQQEVKFATANSKGYIALYNLSAADELETVCQWTETRLRDNHFVGLATTSEYVYRNHVRATLLNASIVQSFRVHLTVHCAEQLLLQSRACQSRRRRVLFRPA
mgnify:CR=1 FL=1